mgnify:CR=1 FL=1
MIKKLPKQNMGKSNLGWLKSRFHFSFAEYRNPKNINFGVLRVLNDDLKKGNLCLALPQTMPSAGHLTMMLPQNRYPSDATRIFKKWLLQSIIT